MKGNYTKALALVLRHEGGWADHPRDPGGATMKGVTLNTFRSFYGHDRTRQELRNITQEQLETIYHKYWEDVKGDDLPGGIDSLLFDMGVNAGPKRAVKLLQRTLGVTEDGILGPITLGKLKDWNPVKLVEKYSDTRLAFYRSLKTFDAFGKGWTRRTEESKEFALGLLHSPETPSAIATSANLPEESFAGFLKKYLGL